MTRNRKKIKQKNSRQPKAWVLYFYYTALSPFLIKQKAGAENKPATHLIIFMY